MTTPILPPLTTEDGGELVWADLLGGRAVFTANIARAEKALVHYDEALDRLRPLMESDLGMTVEDAVKRLRAQEVTAS